MNFRKSRPKCELDVLLQQGRAIPPIPDSVRARALARACSAAATASTEQFDALPVTRHRGSVIALASSVAFVVGAAGATAAIRGRAHNEPPRAIQLAIPHMETASRTDLTAPPPASEVAPQLSVESKTARTEASASARESYAAELVLLQRVQAAYADRNFATTLLLISEHTRRFPNGRLAEEREALHVKALMGAGREEEARRAALAFAARFPRSALLPRPSRGPSGGD